MFLHKKSITTWKIICTFLKSKLLLESLNELDEQQINLNDAFLNGSKPKDNAATYEPDHFVEILVNIQRVK